MLLLKLLNSRKKSNALSFNNKNICKLLLLLTLIGAFGVVETQENSKENTEDIDITVQSGPYSIQFFINDTENYELQNVTCKIIKSFDDGDERQAVALCDMLNPCSKYLAVIWIKSLMDDKLIYVEKTVETSYITPNTSIVAIDPGIESIKIVWNTTDATCISTYEIEVKSSEKDSKWTGSDKTEYVFDGLNPCQDQFIQLKTFAKENILISNLTSNTTTLYAEPGSVNLTFTDYDYRHKKVTWESPKYKTCIDYYYLNWYQIGCVESENKFRIKRFGNRIANALRGSDDSDPTNTTDISTQEGACEWSAILESNAKEFIITGLQGCEKYMLEMHINSKATAKNHEEFDSPEQVPSAVTSLSKETHATNMTLLWNPPKNNAKCVKSYNIIINGPLQKLIALPKPIINSTTDTSLFIDNLDPCGQYNYSIAAISLNGTIGEIINSDFKTEEDNPSAVQNLSAIPYPRSIEVFWKPPEFADLCLDTYRLTGWQNNKTSAFDVITPNTTIIIEGLNSCTLYTIQIIPVTKNHIDGDLKQIDVETQPSIPEPPTKFQITGTYPHSFDLSAMDLNNTCKTIYAHFSCTATDEKVNTPFKFAEKYVDVSGTSFQATLAPLSPFTSYKCEVQLLNVAGLSDAVGIVRKTSSYFPERPKNVTLQSSTQNTVSFVWSPPHFANGDIKLYSYFFQFVERAYFRPPDCKPMIFDPISRETASLEQSFQALAPYAKYSIQIAAQNEYGVGEYTNPLLVKTDPFVSEPVTNINVKPEGPFGLETDYKANAVINFQIPCKSNGIIDVFELEFSGQKNNDKQYFQRQLLPKFDDNGTVVYNETNLKPEYNYTLNVTVRIKNVKDLSAAVTTTFEAPAGIPQKLNSSTAAQTEVNAYQSNNPTNSAVVRFPKSILESDFGTIIYVAILLSEKSCNPEPELHFGAIMSSVDWPEMPTWYEVYKSKNSDCIIQYQTTPIRWQPSNTRNNNVDDDDDIEFTIGNDKCDSSSTDYCNGPLKADTDYHLILRLFTKSGFNDAVKMEFKTDSLIQLKIILISISSCLLLAFIIGIFYLWITKRLIWHRESCHGVEDSLGDVVSKNFALHYRDLSKPEKIAREFKELTMVAMDLSYAASELGCSKNRYADIFPYDKNRVILDIDADGSDYINASFIDGFRRKKEYIATQGPKPESTMDFWRMILQYNVRIIVMVTQFREGDTIKCHEYFPYQSKGINVNIKKREILELYDRTEMSVTHEKYGLKQKCTHFYFKKWPDHGCPLDPMHLITFVRKVKAEPKASYSPIVVHCSAGVGRTGTFIGLDIIMQRLKNENKINIYETVKKLRFQRMKMVQTLAQYSFLYTCSYELVKHKYPINSNNKNTLEEKQIKDAINNGNGYSTKNGKTVQIVELPNENEYDVLDKNAFNMKENETFIIGTLPTTKFFDLLNKDNDLDTINDQNIQIKDEKLKSTEM